MKNTDHLSTYLKELPVEEPSVNFTLIVMDRVRLETVKSNVVYQPLISWQVWRRILTGFALLLLGSVLLYSYFPDSSGTSGILSTYKIDSTLILKPLFVLTQALSKLSFTYVAILMAISVLLFFDQIYSRFTDR
jgi:hypothetical protein